MEETKLTDKQKKDTVEFVEEFTEPNCVLILMDYAHGQSFYQDTDVKLQFRFSNIDIISECVAPIIAKPNFPDMDEHYLDCENEELKLAIIQETLKRNQKIKFVTEELKSGSDWGLNIRVKFPKDEKELLENKRNKLNRKISTLKKANLEN
jgi:hypothetical protein